MVLTVGTDSTWSLRVWICCQLAQLDVELNVIDLTNPIILLGIFKTNFPFVMKNFSF